jgi:GNAT superfamily N-acetyltransferase
MAWRRGETLRRVQSSELRVQSSESGEQPLTVVTKASLPHASEYRVVLHDPNVVAWHAIAGDVMRIEREAFGRGAFEEAYLRSEFEAPENAAVLLQRDGVVVAGFTLAGPIDRFDQGRYRESKETAYISDTVIEATARGQRWIAVLMEGLERELRRRGYRFVERHAAVANGYAGKISRAYGDRVVCRGRPLPSEWGPQAFFRIRL